MRLILLFLSFIITNSSLFAHHIHPLCVGFEGIYNKKNHREDWKNFKSLLGNYKKNDQFTYDYKKSLNYIEKLNYSENIGYYLSFFMSEICFINKYEGHLFLKEKKGILEAFLNREDWVFAFEKLYPVVQVVLYNRIRTWFPKKLDFLKEDEPNLNWNEEGDDIDSLELYSPSTVSSNFSSKFNSDNEDEFFELPDFNKMGEVTYIDPSYKRKVFKPIQDFILNLDDEKKLSYWFESLCEVSPCDYFLKFNDLYRVVLGEYCTSHAYVRVKNFEVYNDPKQAKILAWCMINDERFYHPLDSDGWKIPSRFKNNYYTPQILAQKYDFKLTNKFLELAKNLPPAW
jgi:hypothetical protein